VIVRLSQRDSRPGADDADVVASRREARRELIAEALGTADRGIAALREEDLHRARAREGKRDA
jgi:hypothetical protein